MDVEIRLNTRASRAAADQAMRRILARVARETAARAGHDAPRRSGFLASTAGSTGPGETGRPAETRGDRRAARTPDAGPDEAYAFVAAAYALFVELKQPFLLPAVQAVLVDLDRLVAEEGL